MNSLVRRRWLVTALALAAATVTSCIAPTLPPLPPPQAKASAPVEGEVEITGEVMDENAGAMVLGLNNQTGEMSGELMEADQTRFSFRLRAKVDDVITVFYLAHDEQSEAANITVRAGADEPAAGSGDAGSP